MERQNDAGWLPAQDLTPDQRLSGMHGEWTPIDPIDYTRQSKPDYNLRVTAAHTDFLGTPTGCHGVLVVRRGQSIISLLFKRRMQC